MKYAPVMYEEHEEHVATAESDRRALSTALTQAQLTRASLLSTTCTRRYFGAGSIRSASMIALKLRHMHSYVGSASQMDPSGMRGVSDQGTTRESHTHCILLPHDMHACMHARCTT